MPVQLAKDLIIAERFRLDRPLGRGAMGSVWQATHLGLETACALKFIEGEYAGHAEAHARFQLEAKAAARLRSPHVVQILDHGVFDGMPYIAMELLEGEDLAQRLRRVGKLRPQDAVAIAVQVCRALTKAHGAGVVHRDLKPANVFLVPDDDREIAKVLDFGIAKTTSALDASSTKTGAILGTPSYMSPEQAQGTRSVDHRSDLWSVAVIVYECVTGELPFESEALGDLFLKIMVNPLPVPSAVAPELQEGFDAWWQRAAARDPNERFQSARELADSLAIAFGMAAAEADGESIRAVLPSSQDMPATSGKKLAWRVAGGGVAAGLALGAIFLFSTRAHEAVPLNRVPAASATVTVAAVAPDLERKAAAPVVSAEPVALPSPAASASATALRAPRATAWQPAVPRTAKPVTQNASRAAAPPLAPAPSGAGVGMHAPGVDPLKEFWGAVKKATKD